MAHGIVLTTTGTGLSVMLPLPSSPKLLDPQQYAVFIVGALTMPHVWSPPALRSVKLRFNPLPARTGTVLHGTVGRH